MQENEKEEQALHEIAEAFVNLLKGMTNKSSETRSEVNKNKEDLKDDLVTQLIDLSRKAHEEKRAMILLMESGSGKGFCSIITGPGYKLQALLTETAKEKKEFEELLKKVSVTMSISAIDDLMKHNNPFKKTEPAPAS